MSTTLPAPVQGYITASNVMDGDALIGWFADDALLNDARREFRGKDAIRAWLDRELIADKVTMEPPAPSSTTGTSPWRPSWTASTTRRGCRIRSS